MSKYKGLFTFDVDNHRYLPVEQADGLITNMGYRPEPEPKEPLIKDEKIRKAVRAWAEVLNIEGVSIEHRCAGELCEVHSVFCGLSMEFDGSIMSDIQDGDYTITELCGEEEE